MARGSGFYSIRRCRGVAFVSIASRVGAQAIDNHTPMALAISGWL
jgi:hypothetical protein